MSWTQLFIGLGLVTWPIVFLLSLGERKPGDPWWADVACATILTALVLVVCAGILFILSGFKL